MQLPRLLARSAATEAFHSAISQFLETGESSDRINFGHRSPPIKVERTLSKILEAYPSMAIDRVAIEATSGCESFRGRTIIEADDRTVSVDFEWNCRWKAEELGWTDWFGFPDQARAAREFGYDCFRLWEEADGDERNAA